MGTSALVANTTADNNTAVGYAALTANIDGHSNTAVGDTALDANTSGDSNVAIGRYALTANTTANANVAVGQSALGTNTTGASNVAVGTSALGANTTAGSNTGVGYAALAANITGANNTAFGANSLLVNTTGLDNVAVGATTLDANTTASYGTAVGKGALTTNTTGASNTAVGFKSLEVNTTGHSNTAVGNSAGDNITTGDSNIIIGSGMDAPSATADSQLNIGNWIYGSGGNIGFGVTAPSNKFEAYTTTDDQIVASFKNGSGSATATVVNIASARGDVLYALQCFKSNTTETFRIESTGNALNTNNSYGALSDIKLKENVVDATPKLTDLMGVKVRNYNLIGETTKQIGVIAQELETVFPLMVDESIDRDTDGVLLETTTKSVKYSVFVPILVKAIQEQQTLIEALTARITTLEG
tara:strand:- start:1063 stop:2313 length:1251 start_codon:yes stop_codon:yes gene_type:complete